MKFNTAISAATFISFVATRVIQPLSTSPNLETNDFQLTTAFWDDDYASPSEWATYTTKGGALMCGLTGSDETAGSLLQDTRNPRSAASPFTSDLKSELSAWHWRSVNPSSFSCSFSTHWGFPHAMRSLGLSGTSATQGGDNHCYRIEHWEPDMQDEHGNQVPAINQWYSVPGVGRQYRATKAHYEFAINPRGGALFGLFLESPQSAARTLWYAGKRSPNLEDLPALRAFSDILWGYWVRDNAHVGNVRFLFMIGISNDVTNRLIASALRDVQQTLGEWPGTEFGMGTEQGKALLGSPNGAAFAYFLMQHKAQLGQKIITKVTVFRPENDDDVDFVDASLCFHVADGGQVAGEEMGGRIVSRNVADDGTARSLTRVHEVHA
ncbi:hypothetical protein COCC4DRAFT_147813 [Bipolaris maydis ATCC 48331]|uniref:Uncharacterized protein n=2 Tax=Cochliobolus heterostrophus TaxID=5016 RepID=M2TAN9_COCH5|nr:uncharacterized protein COCC4DRAFT_147813 [Bipolaris maydis ATCC 48331]EMD94635.1 hypothetical protein COCHEDRAFT_1152511 [Bipolaris maydis C5]KAJ5062205.1 hypothetical protein J3E74DRAFT_211223 [Bipolaris maydis]ENI01654.1 hypothetical protein COCC4DRAFT_147813 [Bipolaris maydis ATCC 48331]KAJ6192464.1 hypothetical protein J3E72DRAFT_203352 [Bipolaris maydis]KAJ6215184.1 hypothetical protein PSV09DRAFT_1152511 [Bipolaris maydis]